jgi:hypothetical protein
MAEKCDRAMDTGGALVAAWDAAQGRGRPAQLPATLASLVGRDSELTALAAGLVERSPGTPRVVVIDGPAGSGKTALALQWAHQVRDRFPDGQLYMDLGGFAEPERRATVDEVLESFLVTLGVSTIPVTTDGRAALYRTMMAGRRMLVVLDNAGDAKTIDRLLPASASCGVVVTSRRALLSLVTQVGATRVTAGPLTEVDSIALVRQLVGAARADAEPEAMAAVARFCGGLPLALRAAAEQIATYPHWSIADLVEQLGDEGTACLDALEMVDLRRTFSWSYEQVGSDAARVFQLIGLHRGPGIHLAAVAAVVGVPRSQVRRLLHKLAVVHLVDIDADDVVRLHPLVRAYARELADHTVRADDRAVASRRLVSWYVGTTRAASLHLAPGQVKPIESLSVVDGIEPLVFHDAVAAKAWCETEMENFGPITTLALDYGPRDAAHQLATGLHDMGLLEGAPMAADVDEDEDDVDDVVGEAGMAVDDQDGIDDWDISWHVEYPRVGWFGPPWLRHNAIAGSNDYRFGARPEGSACGSAWRKAAVAFLSDPNALDRNATARLWGDLCDQAGWPGGAGVPEPRPEPGSNDPSRSRLESDEAT